MADAPEVMLRLLLASAVVSCAYFIAEGVTDLLRSDLEAGRSPEAAPQHAASVVSGRQDRSLDARVAFTRSTTEAKRAPAKRPIEQPPAPKPLAKPPPADSPSIEPCKMDLRIAGAAFLQRRAGDSLVMFSGPKGQTGPHSVGSWVGDKTIAAIYPTAVVLRGARGVLCRIAMSTEYAREVAGNEQRADARKTARDKAKTKADARAKAQAEKRKKKR
jgi:hypothetical protein